MAAAKFASAAGAPADWFGDCSCSGLFQGSSMVNRPPRPGSLRTETTPPQQSGHLADQREPQPGARILTGQPAVNLRERLEDPVQVRLLDSDPRVPDRQRDDPMGGAAHDVQPERASHGGELDSVAEQVDEDLLDSLFIGLDDLDRAVDVQEDPQLHFVRRFPDQPDRRLTDRGHIYRAGLVAQLARVDLGDVEDSR